MLTINEITEIFYLSDEFSKEFEELHINAINCEFLKNDDENESIIPDEMKSKIKETIANKNVTEEATKQVLTLAKKYGVTKLLTIIYFKNGKPVKEYVGILTPEELLEASKKNFN